MLRPAAPWRARAASLVMTLLHASHLTPGRNTTLALPSFFLLRINNQQLQPHCRHSPDTHASTPPPAVPLEESNSAKQETSSHAPVHVKPCLHCPRSSNARSLLRPPRHLQTRPRPSGPAQEASRWGKEGKGQGRLGIQGGEL